MYALFGPRSQCSRSHIFFATGNLICRAFLCQKILKSGICGSGKSDSVVVVFYFSHDHPSSCIAACPLFQPLPFTGRHLLHSRMRAPLHRLTQGRCLISGDSQAILTPPPLQRQRMLQRPPLLRSTLVSLNHLCPEQACIPTRRRCRRCQRPQGIFQASG